MATIEEKYGKQGAYPNPSRNGKMQREDALAKVQYIFSNYVSGVDATKFSSRLYYEELRAYAAGRQAEEKYMPYFLGSGSGTSNQTFNNGGIDIGGAMERKFDTKEFARKALSFMNWKVMSPMPKIMNKIQSSFYGNMYNINIECIDEDSVAEQDKRKWMAYVQSGADYIATMQELSQAAGVPYSPPDKRFANIEELELHEANGGFKLNYATNGEKVIKDAWNISNEEEIVEKVIDDIATLNVGAYRVYYDREIGKEMIRYCDPAFSGIQFSKHNDFRDSSYAYELTFVPAYKLQSYGIDITEIPSIAERHAGLWGNPSWGIEFETKEQTDIDLRCGFFKVPVMDVEWIDVETEKKVRYNNKFGQQRVRDYVEGENLTANKQYEETKLHTVYQCKWIVDTDIIYDWGIKPNQPKREKNQAILSFHFIKGKTNQSLVEQLIPVLDDFQLNWLKFQDAKASAVKGGYQYEWEALTGMSIGGNKLDPWDLIHMHRISGNIITSRRLRHQPNQQIGDPVKPLPNSIGTTINDLIIAMDANARMIEEITGINPVAMGSTADPRAGKAVTEMSVSSSGSPIKNIFDKVFKLKEHTSLDLLMRVQLDLRNSPTVRKRYESVIGEFGVQTLIEAEGKGVRFGTKLKARPTEEDLAVLKQYIDTALAGGKNGNAGLTIPQAMYITRRIKEGADMVEIENYVSWSLKQEEERSQQYAADMAQRNIDGQQQGIALKAQVDQMNAKLEIEKTEAIEGIKYYYDFGRIWAEAQAKAGVTAAEANGVIPLPPQPQSELQQPPLQQQQQPQEAMPMV